MLINPGFTQKRKIDDDKKDRLPPGQYQTNDFPVLSLGPTPIIKPEEWKLKVHGLADHLEIDWKQLNSLPVTQMHVDIHCVTKWSKFDTEWEGFSFDELIKLANVSNEATHVIAYSADGYSTNLPIEDLTGGKALIAYRYDDEDISPQHGGPVRLFVPHLYFWKSAKWLNELQFTDHDEPGFWEVRGYHNYGDPWKEQRYEFDE